jgi:tetratricopeptide (TPR) repeat protein
VDAVSDVDVLVATMRAQADAGRAERALEIYDCAPPRLREAPLARYAAGTLAFELGRLDVAEAAFRGALVQEPGNPDFVVNLVTTLLTRDKGASTAKEALALLESASPSERTPALAPTLSHLHEVALRLLTGS